MDATDRQRDAEGGEGRGGGRGGEGEEGGGEETDIKSNNPHLTGGEIFETTNQFKVHEFANKFYTHQKTIRE